MPMKRLHVFTSSLGISRWKDMKQINGCGHRAAEPYDDLVYWDFNWRKGGGSARMIEISKREHFYQQGILRLRLLPARFQMLTANRKAASPLSWACCITVMNLPNTSSSRKQNHC